MRATSKALPLEEKAGISPVGIKKLSTGCDPETFLEKVGFGKTVVNLKEKEAVFSQGDPANAVFYIQKGRVKLTVVTQNGKEATIALLGAGGVGEGCMASAHPRRMATAAALWSARYSRSTEKRCYECSTGSTHFPICLSPYLLARNIRFEADLVDQLFNCSEKRLARVLLLLSKFGKTDKAETMIPNISQETLAGMVGTTRARVSFFMNQLQAVALNEGLRFKKRLWREAGREQLGGGRSPRSRWRGDWRFACTGCGARDGITSS